jgi:hypothetical protein
MEQVRRGVNFRGGRCGFAACGQNAPVRQQQRGGMIASKSGQARHHRPRASCRIPHLRRVSGIARVKGRGLSSSASAGDQDFAVRKQCSIVEFASSGHHRLSVRPSGRRTVQVDYLCGFRWIDGAIRLVKSAGASTHNQYLAVIVHH